MNYLFYLEPYAFLLRSNDKTVVYNTLNATYLICPDYPIVQLIIEQWQNPTNGYSVCWIRNDGKRSCKTFC